MFTLSTSRGKLYLGAGNWMPREPETHNNPIQSWIDKNVALKGTNLKTLSAKAKVGQSTLSMIRSGKRKPSREIVIRIADALDSDHVSGLIAAGFLPEGYAAISPNELIATVLEPAVRTVANYNNAPGDIQAAVDRILAPYADGEAPDDVI